MGVPEYLKPNQNADRMPQPPPLSPASFLNSMQDLDFEIPHPRTTSRTEHNRSQSWSSTALRGLPVPKYPSVHSRSASMDTCSISGDQTPFIKQTHPINLSAMEGPLVTPNSYITGYLDDLEINAPADIRNAPFMTDYEQGSHARSQSWSAGTFTLESKVSNTNSAPILGFRTIEYSQDAEISMRPPPDIQNHPPEPLQFPYPQNVTGYNKSTLNDWFLPETPEGGNFLSIANNSLQHVDLGLEPTAVSSAIKPNESDEENIVRTRKRKDSKLLTIQTSTLSEKEAQDLPVESNEAFGEQNDHEGRKRRRLRRLRKDTDDNSINPLREAYLLRQRENSKLRRLKQIERESLIKIRLHELKNHNNELKAELLSYQIQIDELTQKVS